MEQIHRLAAALFLFGQECVVARRPAPEGQPDPPAIRPLFVERQYGADAIHQRSACLRSAFDLGDGLFHAQAIGRQQQILLAAKIMRHDRGTAIGRTRDLADARGLKAVARDMGRGNIRHCIAAGLMVDDLGHWLGGQSMGGIGNSAVLP